MEPLGSRRGCVSGSGLTTRTVSSVKMLSSSAPRVESKVSFPASVGEDGREEPSVATTSGTSSSSGITISPSRTRAKPASVITGTSGSLSLSNRLLMAVATPVGVDGAEVLDFPDGSPGELSGEPNAV